MNRQAKRLFSVLVAAAMLLAFLPEKNVSAYIATLPEPEKEIEKRIKLNETSITLKRGEKFQLTAEVQIPNFDSEDVEWRSSEPLVADVDNNGLVTTSNKFGFVSICASVGWESVCCDVYIPPEEDFYINWKDKVFHNKTFGKPPAQYNVFQVKAAGGKGKIKVSWKKQKKAKWYELQRAEIRGGKYKTIAKQKKAKYTDKAVKNGIGYKYRVCSVGTDGKRKYSSVVKARSSGEIAADEKLQPPSHVEAKLYDDSRVVELKWTKTEDADGYCVYRRTEDGLRYKPVRVLRGNKQTRLYDEDLKLFHIYEYKVAAFWNRKGKRVYSEKSYPVLIRTYEGENPKITNAENLKIRLKGPDVKKNKNEMNLCSTAYAKVTLEPEYLYYEDQRLVSDRIIWSSSDKSILQVDGKGVITSGTKEGYCTIYARTHNGITKGVKIKVVNFANPTRFPQYGSRTYDINRLLASYRSEVQDIMTYFTIYGEKGESGTIYLCKNMHGEHVVRGMPALKKISLVEKKIRKIIKEFPLMIKISYDYDEVTFKVNYSSDSCDKLTYSRDDRFDKNYWQMAPHWKYYHFVPV